ncbi:muscarinic acetylcholine receptor M5-like [Ptychodera flava]|uniref:muscarinic acetylcholine receptor M5-like n=1 Tax=Ptychodera flava TaxID=63121 RepID=UPI00396A45D7
MYNDSIVNSTTESQEDYERPVSPYSLPVKITLGVVVVVITVVAIVGNALILTAFFTTARLRRLTNYFYASLAVTDLLAGLLVMPLMASYTLLFYWNFWKPFCMAWLCMDMFLYSASVYHMCVICLDRFLAITFPLKYRLRRTKKLILGFIATAWALALIFEVPATLIYEHVSGESVVAYHKECDVEWVEDVAVTVVSFLVTVVIPFFFTLVLYVHIFVTIRRSHRYSKPVGERKGDMNADKSKEARKKCPIQITCLPDTACFICPIKRARKDKELEQVDDTELEAGSNPEKRRDSGNRNTQRRPCRSCCRFSRNSSYDVSGCGNEPHEVVDDHRDSVTMIDFQYNDLTK